MGRKEKHGGLRNGRKKNPQSLTENRKQACISLILFPCEIDRVGLVPDTTKIFN